MVLLGYVLVADRKSGLVHDHRVASGCCRDRLATEISAAIPALPVAALRCVTQLRPVSDQDLSIFVADSTPLLMFRMCSPALVNWLRRNSD
jgi:hypothetical protein